MISSYTLYGLYFSCFFQFLKYMLYKNVQVMKLGIMLLKKIHIHVVPCERIAEEVSFG